MKTKSDLAIEWLKAKGAERAANLKRLEVEKEIIDQLGCPEESSKTTQVDEALKVIIKGSMSYKADIGMLLPLLEQLPAHMRPIKVETKLDETGAKYLRNNEPNIWRLIAPAITVKPAKPSITVEQV